MRGTSRQFASRVARPLKPVARAAVNKLTNFIVDHSKVDPRIRYPSYKSLDDYVDVARLKSLDGYLSEVIAEHAQSQSDEYFTTGLLTHKVNGPKKPGSRIIYLSQSKREFQYMDLNNPEMWVPSKDSLTLTPLMDFIATLPFKATARMMIMYDDSGSAVTAHRDHPAINVCHEFIWFRTNLNKPFYMLNHKTKEKRYVESYTAWFDSVNQFHGADAKEGLSVSIRIDGIFSDDLRKRIPVPPCNVASTPSLWSCTESSVA